MDLFNFLNILSCIFSILAFLDVLAAQSNKFKIVKDQHLSTSVRDFNLATKVKVLDKMQCMMECGKRSTCSMFGYDTIETMCSIYMLTIYENDSEFVAHTGHNIYVKEDFFSKLISHFKVITLQSATTTKSKSNFNF